MSGQQWPGTPVNAAPAQQRSAPQPVITLPNADQAHDNGVQDAGAVNDQRRTDATIDNFGREAKQGAFSREDSLRKEFQSDPNVQAYQAAVPMLAASLNPRSKNGQGDLTLVVTYAKLSDPMTGVRQGEQESINATSPYIDATIQKYRNQLDGSGFLPPAVRQHLEQEVINLTAQRRTAYEYARKRYGQDAGANGIDPERVTGPHFGQDFLSTMQEYDKAHHLGRFKDTPDGTHTPEMRGGLPVGTDITFGQQDPDNPFDRTAWLKANKGINPDQETWLVAFSNANRGNKNLSFEGVNAAFAQQGIPPLSRGSFAQFYKEAQDPSTVYAPFDTTDAEKQYKAGLQAKLTAEGFDPNSGMAYADRASRGTALGGADELNGVAGASHALGQGDNPIEGYKDARNLDRMRYEQEQQAQGILGSLTEIGGSLPTAFLGGPIGTVGDAAKVGGVMGTVSGFNRGNGMGDSLRSAVTDGVAGAGLGALIQKVAPYAGGAVRRVMGRNGAPATEGAQVMGAADRLNELTGSNIAPIPADVSGAGVRNLTAGMAKLPLSARSIVQGGENVSAEAKVARDYVAKLAGNPAELETAGESGLSGAQSFIKRSRSKVNALYAKAKALGGDTPVDLANARAALDEHIGELAQTPGGAPGLDTLKALRAEMDGPFPVEGVKRMRTTLRDKFSSDGLRGSDLERRVGQVVDAADVDVADSLVQAGKGDAAKAYAEASAAHKERVGVIDNVLAPIIGRRGDAPLSGEQIMGKIAGLTKSNNIGLSKFLAAIPEEDAGTIRATLISRLGNASNGTQNAAGDAFSLPQFLTHWNAMTPAAKGTLFGGQLRAALDDLATVANGTKAAQKYANVSNTGTPVGLIATSGVGGVAFSHPIAATFALLSQYGGGKLLASPAFARWLARMPKEPRLAANHAQQLTKIAAANPIIAGEARDLQRQLLESFSSGPRALAADADPGRNEATPTTIPVPR